MNRSYAFVLIVCIAVFLAAGGCARRTTPHPFPSAVRASVLVLRTISPPSNLPVLHTIPPSHRPPLFGPATPTPEPPPPNPNPNGTPYHFSTEHLYVSGSIQQHYIWSYALPLHNNDDGPVAQTRVDPAPHGLAIDNEGNLFVVVTATPSILEFHTPLTNGATPSNSGGMTQNGDAIAIGADDRIFVTDPQALQIVVYGHGIEPGQSPTLAMDDAPLPDDTVTNLIPAQPFDAAFDNEGELFVTNAGSLASRPTLVKFQVPFSVVRKPVYVQHDLGANASVTFTRFPQRLFLPYTDAEAIQVADFNYGQPSLNMPHALGAFSYGRAAIDNDDNLYVLGSDGVHQLVYVFYRPHGIGSQPTFILNLPATTTAGIAVGP